MMPWSCSGIPIGPTSTLWYSDTGCQEVDNGHVSVFLLAGGDFGSAVDAVVAAPSEGPATPVGVRLNWPERRQPGPTRDT